MKSDIKTAVLTKKVWVRRPAVWMFFSGTILIAAAVLFLWLKPWQSRPKEALFTADGPRQRLVMTAQAGLSGDQTVLDAIDDKMTALASFAQSRKAQLVYLMALTDKAEEYDNFAAKLASCFWDSSKTDEELLEEVNTTFSVNIQLEDFMNLVNSVKDTEINTATLVNPSVKNNRDLAAFAVNAYHSGWGYVYGTYGQVLDQALVEDRKEHYPENIGMYYDFIESNWMNSRVADCSGLIKAYWWLDASSGEVVYESNGIPDMDANSMYQTAAEKGPMDTMPDIPGLAVWMNDHIGVYVGNGEVIEAMGTEYGVVKSSIKGRDWKGWAKLPYIQYEE